MRSVRSELQLALASTNKALERAEAAGDHTAAEQLRGRQRFLAEALGIDGDDRPLEPAGCR